MLVEKNVSQKELAGQIVRVSVRSMLTVPIDATQS